MKKLLIILLAISMIIALSACSQTEEPSTDTDNEATDTGSTAADPYADIQDITVKMGITVGWDDEESVAAIWAMHRMEEYWLENSGGKIKLEVYDNSVLGGDEAMMEAISQGTLTMTYPTTENLTTYNNDFSILSLPFLFTDIDQVEAALDGDLGDLLADHMVGTGLAPVNWYMWGARDITNNVRPINEPADLEGIKMRVMNAQTCIDMYETLGANPTPMNWSEVFIGLQQGTVEGQENPASTVYAANFYEVQKYISLTHHIYGFCAVVVGEDWFK